MIRQKIPGLSAWTLDEVGAKLKCESAAPFYTPVKMEIRAS